MYSQIIFTIIGGLLSGLTGLEVARWKWRQDGLDQFQAVIADMRAKLCEKSHSPAAFLVESIPILREAVYRVRPFAKDWDGLHKSWREYEALSLKDASKDPNGQNDLGRTEFNFRVIEAQEKQSDVVVDWVKRLTNYLDDFELFCGKPHRYFMNKKRVANEWLYFLGCFLFGLLVMPLFLFGIFSKSTDTLSKFASEFYSALWDKHDALITWLVVVGPYLLFQLVRSVIWAWKTARNK